MVTKHQHPVKGRLRTNATRYGAHKNPQCAVIAGWIYPDQCAAISRFILAMFCICFLTSCNMDFLGFFGSTDLDNRLKERNSFKFLRPRDMTLSLGDEYSFIVLNDTHILEGDIRGLEKLKDVINSEIKFVVFNGDISHCGDRQDIEKFIDIARSLEVPCYPLIGNHDLFFGNWSVWKELIGSTCYRIDGDSATLFMLDSANAYFGNDQLEWLEKELKNAKGRVFVFSHVNLFVKSPSRPLHITDDRERAKIISILRGKCDAMFMSHLHQGLVEELGGVKYIVNDAYRGSQNYCQVTVTKTGWNYEFKKL